MATNNFINKFQTPKDPATEEGGVSSTAKKRKVNPALDAAIKRRLGSQSANSGKKSQANEEPDAIKRRKQAGF